MLVAFAANDVAVDGEDITMTIPAPLLSRMMFWMNLARAPIANTPELLSQMVLLCHSGVQ